MSYIKREQLANMNQHYKRYSLEYFLDAQRKIGFQNVELWLGGPHFMLDSISYGDCKIISKKIAQRGLKVVSTTSPSLAYQYQYSSQEKLQAEKSFGYFSNGIKASAQLGAKLMTINSGWGYYNESPDTAFERSIEFISRLAGVAQSEGIVLALESLTTLESAIVDSIRSTRLMFDKINHPALKVMVDSVAIGYAGETLQQWFDVFGENLIHAHFLDYNSVIRSYAHNIWGEGDGKLEAQLQCFNRNNYTGYLVQEASSNIYGSNPIVADLKNFRMLERFAA